jgi:trans-aconitate methyltransferase
MQDAVSKTPQVAVDLGCGPGYTTHLLADVTRCVRAIGLDSSERFLTLAAQSATDRISFVCHNVTQIPFPTGQSDLIFCRLLLTHLQDPAAVIERWITQLRPQGLLLMEEVEWIRTEHPLLRRYLEIQATLFRQQANELYIGSMLEQQQVNDVRQYLSRVYHVSVSTKQAATMFSMNLPSWKHHPFVQQQYGNIIDQLERNLQELTENATSGCEIEWGMRQLAYEHV